MKEIKVLSRYNDEYKLIPLTDKQYLFKCGDYVRIGFDGVNEEEYEFVDPSGGPFISEGYKFDDDHIVKRIFKHDKGIAIEFE